MTVRAYQLWTDLHDFDRNISGRYDYPREIRHVVDLGLDVTLKYKQMGCEVICLFLGDVYHRSYESFFDGVAANNFMMGYREYLGGMYANLGNHELSYYKDNPFWTLVNEIESERVRAILNKVWQPRGRKKVMEIVDELVDGEVRFVFNHNGCPTVIPDRDGKVNIGLFHTDIYARDIVEDMKVTYGSDIFEKDPVYFDKGSNVFKNYDHAYLGHLHSMYGKYRYENEGTGQITNVNYLASLGRTNHREVKNNFLERNFPVVLVEDGKLLGIEDNKIKLLSREDCVNEQVVLKAQERRREVTEHKEISKYVPIVDDPIENMKSSLVGSPIVSRILEELLGRDSATVELEVIKKLEELQWRV